MDEKSFSPGDVVTHVYPAFKWIDLYVVKRLDDGKYKCRYLQGDVFMADEFESDELNIKVQGPDLTFF